MTATDITAPDVPRDRWGRYLVQKNAYTRATTIASTLEDRFNLEKWQQRMVVTGLGQRPDLYALAQTHADDNKQLNKVAEEAIAAAQAAAGANIGTALHAATAKLDRGQVVEMSPPWDEDLIAYRRTLEENRVTIHRDLIEQVVCLDELKIAGTFDRIVTLPDDTFCIADVKTGQSLDFSWPSISIQLALYAHADRIVSGPALAFTRPMPENISRDIGLVIHLPAGTHTCTLYTVDIGAGWEMVQTALNVRAWRKTKGLAAPYTPDLAVAAPPARRASLIARVETLRDYGGLEPLAALWPHPIPTFKQSDAHTVDELATIAAVLTEVEATVGVPF